MKSLLAAIAWLAAASTVAAAEAPMPRYDHIFVIVEENHTFDEVIGNKAAPNLNRLAQTYGLATEFFGEVHPSEGNYVAMVGGDSFGIHDDDAYWCKRNDKDAACPHSAVSDYPAHTRDAPNLAAQLDAKGLSWKGYFEDIPADGSPIDRSAGRPKSLYAAKHNGFMNFKSVQDDPRRAEKIVGFDRLERDIAAGTLPAFAHIVPNQCDDMHGLSGDGVDEECEGSNQPGLVGRADRALGRIVDRIVASPTWSGPGNSAIVVTFDEGGHTNRTNHAEGCCGASSDDPTNFGGGWIPTVVITNHGPRGIKDATPYNHYSLLRTIEAAFGLDGYAGHAADTAHGVTAMTPLFAVSSAAPAYRVTATIPLGAPDKWDYMAFDAATHRVAVAHGSEITVVDSGSGTVVGRLGPITRGHGVMIANGRVYATSMEPDTLVAFDLVTLKQVAVVPVGKEPDGALYDPATRRGFVVNEGDKTVTAIDLDANKPVFTTDLGGAPEFLAAASGKLYVNIKDSREVVRIDIASGKLDARWPVPECESPHGLAADAASRRLFASCVNGRMMVLDTDKGSVIANLPIGRRTDAAAFDPKRKLAFSSNSEGTLSVIAEKSAGEFTALGDVATAPGARTMALDPESGRIFMVTADVASSEGVRFTFAPGSLKMLVLDPAK